MLVSCCSPGALVCPKFLVEAQHTPQARLSSTGCDHNVSNNNKTMNTPLSVGPVQVHPTYHCTSHTLIAHIKPHNSSTVTARSCILCPVTAREPKAACDAGRNPQACLPVIPPPCPHGVTQRLVCELVCELQQQPASMLSHARLKPHTRRCTTSDAFNV
jgi:hypothetical protein